MGSTQWGSVHGAFQLLRVDHDSEASEEEEDGAASFFSPHPGPLCACPSPAH